MGREAVVHPAPAISQDLRLGHGGEELRIQVFIREDAVERFGSPFWHGEPGSMYAVVVPLFALQVLRASAMNSCSLSLRMYAGAG